MHGTETHALLLMQRDGELKPKTEQKVIAPAENRTRGPTMATLDFTTKPLALDVTKSTTSYL